MKFHQILGGATGLGLTAAFISGTNNFLTKVGVTVVSDPIFYTTLKNVITVVLLIGALLLFHKWREMVTLSKKDWAQLFVIGAIGGALPFALFFTGLSMTSALSKAPATYVAALLVPATLITNVFSMIFVTHTITITQLASAGITAIGVGLLVVYGKRGTASAIAHGLLRTRTQG
ncbi:MAG: DMT family transporter [Patescibacteria group bacterium]